MKTKVKGTIPLWSAEAKPLQNGLNQATAGCALTPLGVSACLPCMLNVYYTIFTYKNAQKKRGEIVKNGEIAKKTKKFCKRVLTNDFFMVNYGKH